MQNPIDDARPTETREDSDWLPPRSSRNVDPITAIPLLSVDVTAYPKGPPSSTLTLTPGRLIVRVRDTRFAAAAPG